MNSICVVIPTYNRAPLLARAIQSVQQQTLQADEIIVIDDGSLDDTSTIVQNQFPSVKYIYQKNKGVSAARNLGIRSTAAQWIALLDSDDEWLPTKLAAQMNALNLQPNLRICHTEELWIRNGRRVNAMKKHKKHGGWIYQHCLPLCAMSPSSVLINRNLLVDAGLFDESLPACEDYDLWLRLCSQHPVLFIEQPQILKYGGHDDQLSGKYPAMDQFRIQALLKILQCNHLSTEDRTASIEMLHKKINVYLNGARKRGKDDEIKYYTRLLTQYPPPTANE